MFFWPILYVKFDWFQIDPRVKASLWGSRESISGLAESWLISNTSTSQQTQEMEPIFTSCQIIAILTYLLLSSVNDAAVQVSICDKWELTNHRHSLIFCTLLVEFEWGKVFVPKSANFDSFYSKLCKFLHFFAKFAQISTFFSKICAYIDIFS